jgi:hypothetical protein
MKKNSLEAALRIITILLILVSIIGIVSFKFNRQKDSNQDLPEFLKKLFIDDLTPEYLGALISILIVYVFLFLFGKTLYNLIDSKGEGEIEELKLSINELDKRNLVITNSINNIHALVTHIETSFNIFSLKMIQYNESVLEKIERINHDIKVIQPIRISEILEIGRQNTDFWYFSGGTGTYTKAVTLPELAKKAAKGQHIYIELMIINPLNLEICKLYAGLRSSLRRNDKDSYEWTIDYVRNQSFATIIISFIYCCYNSYFKVSIGLKNHFSLFRIDVSSSKALLSKEDPKEAALLFGRDSSSYKSYLNDFKQSFQQTLIVKNFDNLRENFLHHDLRKENMTIDTIKRILDQLSLNENLDETNLNEILFLTKNYKNPYEHA